MRRQAGQEFLATACEFNAHHDEYCFLPIQSYDVTTGRPVAMILRPGKTPSGKEIRSWLCRVLRRIRQHWPQTRITLRGDGHYGRREVMDFCENNGLDYVFGMSGNSVLNALVDEKAGDVRTRRATGSEPVLRGAVLADRDQTSVAVRRNSVSGLVLVESPAGLRPY